MGSTSLREYVKRYAPLYSIRVSEKNFGFENNVKSVPLYAVFCIKDLPISAVGSECAGDEA